jgi:hypothetical protein
LLISNKTSYKRNQQKIVLKKVGTFLAITEPVVKSPQSTTNPPQLHHKNTTKKTGTFPGPPQKCQQKAQKKPRPSPGLFSMQNQKN